MSSKKLRTGRLPAWSLLAAIGIVSPATAGTDVVINEVDADQTGTDSAEFLELYDGGSGNTSLTGMALVFFNGAAANDAAYEAFDLDGLTTDGDGYFVLCANAATVPNCDLDVTPNTDLIQNGADAVALYVGDASSFPDGTPPTTTGLVDALVYDTSDPDDAGLLVLLNPGQPQVDENANMAGITESNQRCPNGSGGARNTTTYDQFAPSAGTLNLCGGVGLSINDVSVTEGNAGTVTLNFVASLSEPAGMGGVLFDIATADDTATDGDNDYEPLSTIGAFIAQGASTYPFNVTVNGDLTGEPDERMLVNVTNVSGAALADGQGIGTILTDDVMGIHAVQGSGTASPFAGRGVLVEGIVTGVRSNGYFLQEEAADIDGDATTSEGILVFTGGAPPAGAVVGALVEVRGTVAEFVPAADPLQPPLTEITNSTLTPISTGNPLPDFLLLTAGNPSPGGAHDQLERYEGMLVGVSSLLVSGPTLGSVDEPSGTATSQGVFYGVIPPNPRPYREPGIPVPDPVPPPDPGAVPVFDSNPERIRVDSDSLVGQLAVDVGAGATFGSIVGPLDYTFRTYSISASFTSAPSGGPTPTAVAQPVTGEFTVAAYNLERFFDTVDDPAVSEPVLTATAFDNRLHKASAHIRNYLRFPDILGVVEMENLTTLQALAAEISADAIAAAQPDPEYAAYLVEGNDVGGIDVGFLVKAGEFPGGTPRVQVNAVVQELDGSTWIDPSDNLPHTLNDRPPLRLDAVVHHASGQEFPVTVIVVHQRSLNGVSSTAPDGLSTTGHRVRSKRRAQAEDLANLIQARQVANPNERIVVLGDYNAFEFNDGLVDVMGTVMGTPTPADQVVLASPDLVDPNLTRLSDASNYSFIFDGNAQNLDHTLVNADLVSATTARRVEHPRINTDFPEIARNDPDNNRRLADHDPIVTYFTVASFANTLFIDDFETADTCRWSTRLGAPPC